MVYRSLVYHGRGDAFHPRVYLLADDAGVPALPSGAGLALGVFEILGGLGILVPQTRRFSAWGLLALLVAVFPANINMALNGIVIDMDVPQSDLGRWLRLPFQFVFAAQIYYIGLWRPNRGHGKRGGYRKSRVISDHSRRSLNLYRVQPNPALNQPKARS